MPKIKSKKAKAKKAKKRVTNDEDIKRFEKGFYKDYGKHIKNETQFQKSLKDYMGYTPTEKQQGAFISNIRGRFLKRKDVSERLKPTEDELATKEERQLRPKRKLEYIAYVKNTQVFASHDTIQRRKKFIKIYRDANGRFAKAKIEK